MRFQRSSDYTPGWSKNVPTYTYKCTACDDVVEKRQSFSDPPLTTCEQCGGALRKVFHPVGIVFKGSGWYITDSRSSSSSSANGRTETETKPAKASDSSATPAKESGAKAESAAGSSTASTAPPKAASAETD
jgi:putative FmdB family regulatory protein